jgi:hypothetical protein
LRQFPAKDAVLNAPSTESTGLFWRSAWLAAAIAGTMAIGAFLYLVKQLPPEFIRDSIKMTKVLLILPFASTIAAFFLDARWNRVRLGGWDRFLKGERSLLMLTAAGPFLMLALFAQFRPILNQRGLLFLAPYLLLLLAIGLLTLRKAWIVALLPVLAAVSVASQVSYGRMGVDPADYASFATALQSQIRTDDLVFIRKAWYETPILYYLHKDRYHLVGKNYGAYCSGKPGSDVWVVLLYDNAPTADMQTALSRYEAIKTVTGSHAKAILYRHL